jgi:hypothetical protein
VTSAVEFQGKATKAEVNFGRLDEIVNGGPAASVATDNGTVPSIANALANLVGTDKVFTLADTATLLQAIVPTALQPHLALVTKDTAPANNGFWQYPLTGGGPWVIATALNTALKGATGANGTLAAATTTDLDAGTDNTKSVTPAGITYLGIRPSVLATTALAPFTELPASIGSVARVQKFVEASGTVAPAIYTHSSAARLIPCARSPRQANGAS